jgi:chemosensory pili system protein ChpA (sensor histidine kinase/response regulator)
MQDHRKEARSYGYPVLLVSTDTGATCAIQVQELVDGREVVVKKFGRYVPRIQGTIGAVILGDGSVAPVIDLPELLRASTQQYVNVDNAHAGMPAQAGSQAAHVRTALVVDDSLSARRATAQIMRDAGYEVRTAIDGLDAVAILDEVLPDVILVDMEMPRMNGLELTSHVRARKLDKRIPIIMITSRSTQKHRQQGDAAGVDAYLVKPFSEDALLQHINRLTGV